jgi:hypothetical protein
MMYEGVRGALVANDMLKGRAEESRFRLRETPDLKQHAANLETEMRKHDSPTAQPAEYGSVVVNKRQRVSEHQ